MAFFGGNWCTVMFIHTSKQCWQLEVDIKFTRNSNIKCELTFNTLCNKHGILLLQNHVSR